MDELSNLADAFSSIFVIFFVQFHIFVIIIIIYHLLRLPFYHIFSLDPSTFIEFI